jgi:hypothetical protein
LLEDLRSSNNEATREYFSFSSSRATLFQYTNLTFSTAITKKLRRNIKDKKNDVFSLGVET